ncbi:hypothetical protein DL98DRAFT_438855, partial [Cadophora sp. DSE1049]
YILKRRQNLHLKAFYKKHSPFIRITSNKVIVSYLDKAILLLRANLYKVS